ncbi:hypothetical protein pb186bvf_020998 [Paramecium bursaria]
MRNNRPVSQPKLKNQSDKLVCLVNYKKSQSITSLKSQLKSFRQEKRWSVDINQKIFEFLAKINMQTYYKQVSQLCGNNYEVLIQTKKAIEQEQSKTDSQTSAISQKECCWICFSLIFDGLKFYDKMFCSIPCREQFRKELTIKCINCGKTSMKPESYNKFGEWFCSNQCIFSDEEMLMHLLKKQR